MLKYPTLTLPRTMICRRIALCTQEVLRGGPALGLLITCPSTLDTKTQGFPALSLAVCLMVAIPKTLEAACDYHSTLYSAVYPTERLQQLISSTFAYMVYGHLLALLLPLVTVTLSYPSRYFTSITIAYRTSSPIVNSSISLISTDSLSSRIQIVAPPMRVVFIASLKTSLSFVFTPSLRKTIPDSIWRTVFISGAVS